MYPYKLILLGLATIADGTAAIDFDLEWEGPDLKGALLVAENTAQRVSTVNLMLQREPVGIGGLEQVSPTFTELFTERALVGPVLVGDIISGKNVSGTLTVPANAAAGNGLCRIGLLVSNVPTAQRARIARTR